MSATGSTDTPKIARAFSAGSFLLEVGIYAVLVVGYFFLVLHFLGNWLKQLFDTNRVGYAVTALALIVGQGILLEMLTTGLLKLMVWRRRSKP